MISKYLPYKGKISFFFYKKKPNIYTFHIAYYPVFYSREENRPLTTLLHLIRLVVDFPVGTACTLSPPSPLEHSLCMAFPFFFNLWVPLECLPSDVYNFSNVWSQSYHEYAFMLNTMQWSQLLQNYRLFDINKKKYPFISTYQTKII